MPHLTEHRRLPRAGVDPITAETAWPTVAFALHRPPRYETVAIMLDDARRGFAIVVVNDTRDPDSVLEVVELLTRSAVHGGRLAGLLVASVRPDTANDRAPTRDVDRWLELSDLAHQSGVELLEWFVVAGGVRCPRDDLGEAPRW